MFIAILATALEDKAHAEKYTTLTTLDHLFPEYLKACMNSQVHARSCTIENSLANENSQPK